jgi:hypothetical protein
MTPILVLSAWLRHGNKLACHLSGPQYRRAKFLIERLTEERERLAGQFGSYVPSLAFIEAKKLCDDLESKYFIDHKVIPFPTEAKVIPFRRT